MASMQRLTLAVATFLLYAVVFIVGLEATARLDDAVRYGAPFLGRYAFDDLFDRQSETPGNRPGARYRHWVVNQRGFRGPEIAEPKRPGTIRVAVLGASEIFGLYESPGRDVVSSLQRTLDERAPARFEVINAASPGMTPPRLTEMMRARLDPLEVDVIVLYVAPALYLDSTPPPDVGALPRRTGGGAPRGFQPRILERAWTAARGFLPQALQVRLKTVAIQRARRGHEPEWLWTEPPADRLAIFRAQFEQLVAAAARGDRRVIVVTHANRFVGGGRRHDDPAGLVGWVRFYPRATGEVILGTDKSGNGIVESVSRAYGVTEVDLSGALGGRPELFADFSHFTNAGAAEAARIMADSILATGAGAPATAGGAAGGTQ